MICRKFMNTVPSTVFIENDEHPEDHILKDVLKNNNKKIVFFTNTKILSNKIVSFYCLKNFFSTVLNN